MAQQILTASPINLAAELEHLSSLEPCRILRLHQSWSADVCRFLGSLPVNHWRLHCESAESMAETGAELVEGSKS